MVWPDELLVDRDGSVTKSDQPFFDPLLRFFEWMSRLVDPFGPLDRLQGGHRFFYAGSIPSLEPGKPR
jgi:hypothetical protein